MPRARFDGSTANGAALVRLGTDVHGYVLAPVGGAKVGNFISDTCEGAEPFVVPANVTGLGLAVQVDRSLAASSSVYLQLQLPSGATKVGIPLQTLTACATCAFDTPACPAGEAMSAQGTTYVRLPLTVTKGSAAQVTSHVLYFFNQ